MADLAFQTILDQQSIGYKDQTARQVDALLRQKKLSLASVEMVTDGLWSELLDVAQMDHRFLKGSLVLHALDAKIRLCQLKPGTIQSYGEYSLEAAKEMALGVRLLFGAHLGVSVLGQFTTILEEEDRDMSIFVAINHKDFDLAKSYQIQVQSDCQETAAITALVLLKQALTLKV